MEKLPTVCKLALVAAAWAALLAIVLSIASWPGDWGHALCGPWGCGPPLQALLACHLAWLVVLVPPAMALVQSPRVPRHLLQHIGTALTMAGIMLLLGLIAHELVVWWSMSGEWQRGYFWQRCGFVLATTVDVPTVELLLVGTYIRMSRRMSVPTSPPKPIMEPLDSA